MYKFWDKMKTPTGGPGFILAQESVEIGKEIMYGVQLNKTDYSDENWAVLCPSSGPNKLFYYLESELVPWTDETKITTKLVSKSGKVRNVKTKEPVSVGKKPKRKPRVSNIDFENYDA